MAKTYTEITDKIGDILSDNNFTSNRTAETLRAVNNALDRISMGDTGEDKGMNKEVGYNFQKDIASVSFVNGTEDYTFASLSITNFKFANDLRVNSDENVSFSEVANDYYFRKKGVVSSGERMYTIHYTDGAPTLKINYTNTDVLDFEYFSNRMVNDISAGGFLDNFDGAADDTLLLPDHLWLVVPTLAAADLARQRYGDDSQQPQMLERQGLSLLKRTINSIGVLRKNPSVRVKVRSEWFKPLTRINNN
jgi:hypothetical protein